MHRFALDHLEEWATRRTRKPLVLRGARQVGKSTLVRHLARNSFQKLVELDFERDPDLVSLFTGDPRETLRRLELRFDCSIVPGETLLFFDEIQAAPAVLGALRYFHEELPEFHIVAAGSLLEVLLQAPTFSMPVGRIEYMHLGPMSFEEFLLASSKDRLLAFIQGLAPDGHIPLAIHRQLLGLLRQFMVVGGMPEAVSTYLAGSYRDCEIVQQSILSTYQDDFGKYGRRASHARLVKVYRKLPRLVGTRFKYIHVDRQERSKNLAAALHLLCLARVAHKVRHTSSNGLPLAAEARDDKFKLLFLDGGLVMRALGLGLLDLERDEDVLLVNAGALGEQLVGQHLLYSAAPYVEPELHFWARDKRNSSAEVDYVIAEGSAIVPVEVKSGKSGSLRSLHLFLREKERRLGVRLNSDAPSLLSDVATLHDGTRFDYRLLSLPLYMVGQVRRLVRELTAA